MNILHIDCSPRHSSHSRNLSAAILETLLARHPDATVTRRDLGTRPIPHLSAEYATALSTANAAAAAVPAATALSETIIAEVEAADMIVIGTPVNNFTLPSVLKAWFDQLLRVGRTILPTEQGKVGMLKDRPVFIGIASGGVFCGEGANQPDLLTPYLTAAFNCVGIRSLQYLPVQATAFLDSGELERARAKALAALDISVAEKCA